jgi:hypothetical protein
MVLPPRDLVDPSHVVRKLGVDPPHDPVERFAEPQVAAVGRIGVARCVEEELHPVLRAEE